MYSRWKFKLQLLITLYHIFDKESRVSKFWDKVLKCEHKNLYPDYYEGWSCSGAGHVGCMASEYHCKDCGVYFSECGCHTDEGMSGWPWRRWRNLWKKKGWV